MGTRGHWQKPSPHPSASFLILLQSSTPIILDPCMHEVIVEAFARDYTVDSTRLAGIFDRSQYPGYELRRPSQPDGELQDCLL
jgi:hypothetical protein